ncbi:MAG: tRNA 2-thiouridine(34) synthase MnmA [Candidatus Aminicenantes bacterium]|nr:tRNA 2-thiouridine(34) synthase MnmA [Candidatus Aminicenantes bacterium]
MEKERVAVAMSGGVDSSVAAALLLERGDRPFGLTMDLGSAPESRSEGGETRRRTDREAVEDAARVAAGLGIPFHVVDLRREFEKRIVKDFCREYVKGRTPNPCIRCNARIKFDLLAEAARRFGAKGLATGHHARLERDSASGRWLLRQGRDLRKDQSYFLYALTQRQLSFARFPVGDLTKDEVRSLAARLSLPTAEKPESQEICFIPGRDYARFLKDRIPGAEKPGPILDPSGRVIGRHRGIIHFTLGQRRGLGIASPRPLYVLGIDAERNAVVAGLEKALYGKTFTVAGVNWVSAARLLGPVSLTVKIRSRQKGSKAVIEAVGRRRCRVTFSTPQRAITPGQSAVFYDRDLVIGGGVIDAPVFPLRS